MDWEQPAGSYSVETDEELLLGVSFPVYRWVATAIRLPSPGGAPTTVRIVSTTPAELAAALEGDAHAGRQASLAWPCNDRRSIELDEHRGVAAQKATVKRPQRSDVIEMDRASHRSRLCDRSVDKTVIPGRLGSRVEGANS
jgi:hypothetical protein